MIIVSNLVVDNLILAHEWILIPVNEILIIFAQVVLPLQIKRFSYS